MVGVGFMSDAWSQFVQSHRDPEAVTPGSSDAGVARFGDLNDEYRAIGDGVALVDRSDRALLTITGSDRRGWLHNLTTNEVKNLGLGEGNYAFALNVKGRILFDLNMLVFQDAIWIDLDRQVLDIARRHLEKYTITEDVTVADRSDEFARFAVTGPMTPSLLDRIELHQVQAMASLGSTQLRWSGDAITVVRHDFCGPVGVEIIASPSTAVSVWETLSAEKDGLRAGPAGRDAVNIRRIEAGIPWPPHEINEDVLPAETAQLERAVSYHKGCYLGQEVVERMRSRGVVARRLCGVTVSGDIGPLPDSPIEDEQGRTVGKLGSVCRSLSSGSIIGLAYVKTGSDQPDTRLLTTSGGQRVNLAVTALPFPTAALP